MPVKIEGDGDCTSPIIPKEIDNLVKGIRDRLCLKSQEKLSKYRSTPYSIIRSPCRENGGSGLCQKCSCKRNNWRSCCCKVKEEDESPHKLLEKLLHEQTLIQEAVRRLTSRMESANSAMSVPMTSQHPTTPPHEKSELFDVGSFSKSSSLSSFSFGTVNCDWFEC
ncbi:hypothetical protein LOTGIDRAFT_233494 [Lottia gigantea]|uniref:Uncharacterized protein n=1 Tax=Lottia gigantea TaxID=225164 RepID=V4ACG1_LOTGI|nr:hypothetical protein LOTGIDRAFT_233494 [Lottia gigantea]ESO90991.1 hypothetical protein LOTGIDRAFT_233494 [Lottia gigantea]